MPEEGLREKFILALTATVELYDSILQDYKSRTIALEKEVDQLQQDIRALRHEIDELHKRISAHESRHDAKESEVEHA